MDMNQFWATFWSIMGPLILAGLTWIGKKFTNWLTAKTNNTKNQDYTLQLNNLVWDAVMCVSQTIVNDLKDDGKFTDDEKVKAKETAYNLVISQIGPEMKKYLEKNFGDIKELIYTKIEAIIPQVKR